MSPEVTLLSQERIAEVGELLSGFAKCYNASLTYGGSHPVVARTVEEYFPAFDTVAKNNRDITLQFIHGQVRVGNQPIDPGNAQFGRVAQLFASRGVTGIQLTLGLRLEDLKKFVDLMARQGDKVVEMGLQVMMDLNGVRNIREKRDRQVGEDSIISRKVSQGGNSYAVDLTGIVEEEDVEVIPPKKDDDDDLPPPPPPPERSKESSEFRSYVVTVLAEVSSRRTPATLAAERIADEYEKRLRGKVEEVRKESSVQIKRLENIRDLMLNELEHMRLAALLVDGDLKVIAMNSGAENLIGRQAVLPPGDPLVRFLAGGLERETVTLPSGEVRSAHRILSSGETPADTVILVSLEDVPAAE